MTVGPLCHGCPSSLIQSQMDAARGDEDMGRRGILICAKRVRIVVACCTCRMMPGKTPRNLL